MQLILKHADEQPGIVYLVSTDISVDERDFLKHYRVGGEKKGVRRWQNEDRTLTPAGRDHYAEMYGWGKNKKDRGSDSKSGTQNKESKELKSAKAEVKHYVQQAKDRAKEAVDHAVAIGTGGALIQTAYAVAKYNTANPLVKALVDRTAPTFGDKIKAFGDFVTKGADMFSKIFQGTTPERLLGPNPTLADVIPMGGDLVLGALGAGLITSAAVAVYSGVRSALSKRKVKKLSHASEEPLTLADLDALDEEETVALLMVFDEMLSGHNMSEKEIIDQYT